MTDIETTSLTAARTAAITESGWGTPFRFVQVRNAAFWVFVFGMVAGTAHLIEFYRPGIGAYGVGLGSGVLLFALYTIPWLILLNYHNRYTALPGKLLLVAFAWAAVAGTYWIGLQANTAVLSLYGKAFGHVWARDWAAGLTAPITEELAKATALLLLLGLAPRLVRSPYDGLIIGAFAGLGLQISEDVLYAFNGTASNFGIDQVASAYLVFAGRAGAGLFQHVLFSAVFCSGLMWLLGRGPEQRRLRGLLLMLGAMALHSGWDNAASYGNVLFGRVGPLLMMVLLAVGGLLLLNVAFRLAAPQEQAWARAILAPEVASDVLTDEEASAACGGWKARRRYRGAIHGHRAKRVAGHLLAAANDLARELSRSGGRDSDGVIHARAEIERLRTQS
ncbi:PrsW family glutamic-type intramembrane protease [Micromonospora peucetia]|uniref:PrsW family glutamic-type intramembrane protease n=1 Tax=Micromonospora peucetia TaxID=47871 RepID=UPI00332BF714